MKLSVIWKVALAVLVIACAVCSVAIRFPERDMMYKVAMVVGMIAYVGIYMAIQLLYQKAAGELFVQFDDEKTRKMGLRRIILYDAVLVIVGIVLFISKCVENYLSGIGSATERYLWRINLYATMAWAVVAVTAVSYTVIAFKNAKSPKYEYKKENWVLNINGKEEMVSADVFTKTSSKGEYIGIEATADIRGERISVKGSDIEEAKMKLIDMCKEQIG